MDVVPEGLHGGDWKTFWIGGTRPSLFRYEPGTYGCGRRATDTIDCDGSCPGAAVPHACFALP